MSYGKWILGGLGFALTGTPLGAIAGFALGSFFDNATDSVVRSPGGGARTQSAPRQTTAGDVALSLVVLTAAVMRADGRATQGELAHVRRFFAQQFGPQHSSELLRLLRDMLQRDIPVREVCEQMRGHLSHAERLQLLHFLVGLAHADGRMDSMERELLHRIGTYLGISDKDQTSIHAMFQRTTPSVAYEVLEVDPKASDEEVKKAYRRAAIKHHPDKVAHLGEEFQKAAAEKFKKVQDAWERVKKERGIA